jgi:acyl carrier protein
MSVTEELEKFILTELAFDYDKKSIAPDEDLLTQGIIDSMGIMRLAAFIEEEFGIKISDEDLVPENFQNINSIKKYISLKS